MDGWSDDGVERVELEGEGEGEGLSLKHDSYIAHTSGTPSPRNKAYSRSGDEIGFRGVFNIDFPSLTIDNAVRKYRPTTHYHVTCTKKRLQCC